MKILIGTTNPSKIKRFMEFLNDFDIEFYTLNDLNITDEPIERGLSPEENAVIKAKFYGQFFDVVICNDSGLYFEELPLNDTRQPALNIRTPNNSDRLNDDEMIEYYSKLVKSLGGKVSAFYLDGIAVYNKGNIYSFIEDIEAAKANSFYMINTPSDKRHAGWPLDSLSLNKNTLTYFVEKGNNMLDKTTEQIMIGDYRLKIVNFFKQALGLEQKGEDKWQEK